MAISCDTFTAGNSTYNSFITVCLDSLKHLKDQELLRIDYSIENQARTGPGFFAEVDIGVELDGNEIEQRSYTTSPGNTDTDRVETTVSPGNREVCLYVRNKDAIRLD